MGRALPVLGLLLCMGAVPAEESPSELLQDHLEGARRFHASFIQEMLEGDVGRSRTSRGEVWVHRPDRFRWVYTEPFEQVIVSDGERVWMHDPELEQVTVRPLDDTIASSPAMLLSGDADLEEAFEVSDAGEEEGLRWISLVPRVGDSDFRHIRLGFRDGELERLELTDALDQTTLIRLESVEEGVEAPEGTFRFQVPEGADVIGERGQPADGAPETDGSADSERGAGGGA